ncbi:hypothetical protein [Croceicoccus bisphenolivorans]|uniref:hypothetical protein n=1 Tax=Croceicoccus bisphenolivorans TaxID=1783232 RepID=UPI000AE2A38A|nr:hypothetical protein [Croceicoccus bisphenolivorans]
MKKNLELSCATGAIALAMLSVAPAMAAPGDPIVEIEMEIDQDVSAWTVDRADVATFTNESWEGRDGTVHITISPPANPSSFSNWQGYSQTLDTPAGSASIKGDLWIGSEWAEGTDTDYVRTGIWGSVQPEGTESYVDAQAIFPIISFTNEDGEARLQVWDTTANPSGGWVNLDASESALSLDEWNTFEMRVLPESDRIDYVVNDVVIYSWDMPRGAEDNISDELYAVYLNGRNNGVTSFDTYWSQLAQAQLVLDGESITGAPDGLNVIANAQGSVAIDAGVTVGGTVRSGAGSNVTIAFGEDAGVVSTGEAGVVSNEGGVITLDGGSVETSGAEAPGLLAVNQGSEIHTLGTNVSTDGSAGVVAANGGLVSLDGGIVETSGASSPGLLAIGADSAVIASGTEVAASGSTGALAMTGGTITLDGGVVTSTQFALVANHATIEATDVAVSGNWARLPSPVARSVCRVAAFRRRSMALWPTAVSST